MSIEEGVLVLQGGGCEAGRWRGRRKGGGEGVMVLIYRCIPELSVCEALG